MKVSSEQRPPREAVLTVELEAPDVEPYLERAYRQIVRRANIPGFRKGKAPRRIVEQMYGREYLLNEALDSIVQEVTSKAVEDEGLEIGGVPSVSIDQFDPPSFTATVPLTPIVTLGSFESVRVAKTTPEVDQARVDMVLEQLRAEQATWEPVDETPSMDDLINLSVVGWIDDGAERSEILRSENTDYIPRPDGRFPVPGLDENIVGLEVGIEHDFDVDVPSDFENEELAGKKTHFTVTVHSVKRRILPDLDDEFAKSVGEDNQSLGDLRSRVQSDLNQREEQLAVAQHQEETLAKVVEGATIEISPMIIDHELEHYVHEQEENIRAGRVSMQEYQEFLSWQGLPEEEVKELVRPRVEERLKRAHVVREITVQQGFEASDDEVDAEVSEIIGDRVEQADQIKELFADPERRESVRRMLVNRKAMGFLAEIASRDAPASPKRKRRPAANKAKPSSAAKTPGGKRVPSTRSKK